VFHAVFGQNGRYLVRFDAFSSTSAWYEIDEINPLNKTEFIVSSHQ
jgi:hypothetical protein